MHPEGLESRSAEEDEPCPGMMYDNGTEYSYGQCEDEEARGPEVASLTPLEAAVKVHLKCFLSLEGGQKARGRMVFQMLKEHYRCGMPALTLSHLSSHTDTGAVA